MSRSKVILCDPPSHTSYQLCQNMERMPPELTLQDVLYSSSFIAKSRLKHLKDISQGQRSLHVTISLMIVIICAKYGKNLPRTVHAVERIKDVPYFSIFIAKTWLNDIGWGQWSLCVTHLLMLIIIGAKYRMNPSRTVCVVEQTQQDVPYFSSLLQSHGWMTLKIRVKFKDHYVWHTLSC